MYVCMSGVCQWGSNDVTCIDVCICCNARLLCTRFYLCVCEKILKWITSVHRAMCVRVYAFVCMCLCICLYVCMHLVCSPVCT